MIMSASELWSADSVQTTEVYYKDIIKHKFLSKQDGECFASSLELILRNKSALDVADSIAEITEDQLHNPAITGEYTGTYYLKGRVANKYSALVILSEKDSDEVVNQSFGSEASPIDEVITTVKVEVLSHRKAIEAIFNHVSKSFSQYKTVSIKWWYKYGGGETYKEVYLGTLATQLLPEYYAGTINRDGNPIHNPSKFLEDYLKSNASVLLMSGPPGTGKTTLIRHLISDFNLKAEIIYDESLLSNDSVIQRFLFGDSDLMIIEDADHIINSRELESNPLMSRFLNISDGLIKMPAKKMIFTTNLIDLNKVDKALVRPGRCFDILHTRELSYTEACAAAQIAGLPLPTVTRNYTLAEIFNRTESQT